MSLFQRGRGRDASGNFCLCGRTHDASGNFCLRVVGVVTLPATFAFVTRIMTSPAKAKEAKEAKDDLKTENIADVVNTEVVASMGCRVTRDIR